MSVQPKKALGQHFLKKVPQPLVWSKDELVNDDKSEEQQCYVLVEIGPGLGVVTHQLLQLAEQLAGSGAYVYVMLVEVDTRFVSPLKELINAELTGYAAEGLVKWHNVESDVWQLTAGSLIVEIINKDVLKFDLAGRIRGTMVKSSVPIPWFKEATCRGLVLGIIGSLPYNISKKIIAWSIRQSAGILKMAEDHQIGLEFLDFRFLIQKEVAQDYVSTAPNYAFLGVYLDLFVNSKRILEHVSPGSFMPPPKVDSAILSFVLDKDKLRNYQYWFDFASKMRMVFNYPRKTIGKIFKKAYSGAGANRACLESVARKRPSELTVDEWECLLGSKGDGTDV